MHWYYLLNGQRQGPVDDAGLELLVRQGTVQDDTLVWREGLAEWQPYGSVKPKPAAPPPQAPPRPEPAPPPRPDPTPRPEPVPRPYSPPQSPAMPPRAGSSGAFFFYPILDALNDGRVIRKFVIVALKVIAVLIALGGILAALTILTTALRGTGGTALGGILFAILILGTAACVGQIYWYRAASVAALEHSRNTVIPIFAILSRAGGEAAATGLAGIGLGACLMLWLSPEGSLGMLQGIPFLAQVPAEGGFLSGIIVLVYLAMLGFSALILGYLWAECIMLLVDIERNTRQNP
jgi:hypothetical protein